MAETAQNKFIAEVFELEELDRQILFMLDCNCRMSLLQVAEQLNAPRQTVEYRVKRLQQIGILKTFYASFSPGRMGYHLFKIHARIRDLPGQKQELFSYLESLGNVYWYGYCSGTWNLLIGIFYRSMSELLPIIETLSSRFYAVVADTTGHTPAVILQYPKNYLTNVTKPPFEYMGEISQTELDKIDLDILGELVDDGRRAVTSIAERLNTTQTVVRHRMAKLEKLGVLLQYRIALDLDKLGYDYYKTLIEVNRFSQSEYERFVAFVSQIPNVTFLLRNIWSLELEIVTKSYADYEQIVLDLTKEFPMLVKNIDTLVIHFEKWTPGFKNLLVAHE